MEPTGKLDILKDNIPDRTGLDPSFIDTVDCRLQSFGYIIQDTDAWAVGFAIQSVIDSIRNYCNISAIPEGLLTAAVDMVCGEFLYNQKSVGKELSGINFEQLEKSIQEGDTNITYIDNVSPEQAVDTLLSYLRTGRNKDLLRYRRLVW